MAKAPAPPRLGKRSLRSPLVRQAIRTLSNYHTTNEETDFLRTSSNDSEGCGLRTTFEGHWVAALAYHFYQSVFADRDNAEFNRVFEIPSLRSECRKQGGYDLSVGPFDTKHRYRFMHKTISQKWCDTDWTWRSKRDDDMRHLRAITGRTHAPLRRHRVFLVLNVFYCIHDWRRMGAAYIDKEGNNGAFVIPSYSSALRTVIVDLNPLKEDFGRNEGILVWRDRQRYEGGPAQEYIDSIEEGHVHAVVRGRRVPVLDLEALCTQMADEWKLRKQWRSSMIR